MGMRDIISRVNSVEFTGFTCTLKVNGKFFYMFTESHPKEAIWRIRNRRAFSLGDYDTDMSTCLKFVNSWPEYLTNM